MHSPEYLRSLSNINPELEELLKTTSPGRRLDANTDVAELRQRLLETKKEQSETAPPSPSEFTDPRTPPSGGSPVFVVYHGGGFCLGGLENETVLCRQWTELGGVAVNVDYRLAPEHPFPTGINDAFDALKWTASHVDELKVDPSKGFLVGGISAGANFSSIVSHLYLDEKLSPPLTGVYLSIPPVNKDAPLLNREVAQIFDKYYAAREPSPLATPVLFPSHKDLPPTYFQICGLDPLRDEGFIYEDLLKESGVETKTQVYPGLPHGFWSWFPEAEFSKKFVEDCKDGLSWLLGEVELRLRVEQ
ncbi:hypothetical protein EYC80_006348 [Monilinia laxa]|uniref:Alpha/beta hydrolase fold-3 domain-containing protein n=1 Tax=Monilinia laxa TaxID=61186 RepID=A0A5N6JT54_MONLA|nr:hypothetical protein EYC80_006348 [Monilinia laxa]